MEPTTRELSLNKGKFEESVLYKLKKDWVLRFKLGPDCLAENVSIFTNYPPAGCEYHRTSYHPLPWHCPSQHDKTSHYAQLTVLLPGSFHFYFTTTSTLPTHTPAGGGHFLVDPELVYPLDSIICQTVLSKLLGPLPTWKDKLEVAHRSGYNMVHFTPIQALGASNSAYSLADQHQLNKTFSPASSQATFADVEEVVASLRSDWGLLSICDIVLNHTANETPWLAEQTEATYNLLNCPHLRPAFILDRVVKRLAADTGAGVWVGKGIPKGEISSPAHINVCKTLLHTFYLPKVNIPELFLLDIDKTVESFTEKIKETPENSESCGEEMKIIQDPEYRRNMSTINLDAAVAKYNKPRDNINQEEERIQACVAQFQQDLICLVSSKHSEVMAHLSQAVENVGTGAAYQHVDPHGPRLTAVSVREDQELVAPYFTCPDLSTLEEELELAHSPEGAHCMAHNGWVMGDDPLRNFALPGSNVYLRRELVAWGDSVKLRFGDKPEDSPFLWRYMTEYVVQTARIFDGLRLDNCHSTPLHVASFMLDQARKVRPNLYVSAELFTGSEAKDNMFVNCLGITSLIREGMAAWDSHELGRMVYKYGGDPVGSFKWTSSTQKIAPGTAHALFVDWTHDNPSPVEKRSVQDMLPSAALVSMAACAVGSNRGYDELVPHHIHVVQEDRPYAGWSALGDSTGMVVARRELSMLHQKLAREGFSEVFVDQMSRDVVAITRHSPTDRRSVIMVAFTHFFPDNVIETSGLKLEVEGRLTEVLLEGKMVCKSGTDKCEKFVQAKEVINGLDCWSAEVKTGSADLVKIISDGADGRVRIDLDGLTPGSFLVVEIEPQDLHKQAISSLRNVDTDRLDSIVREMTLLDIQFALFQCDQEGQELGFGSYNVPGWGELHYCGLAGLVPVLDCMRPSNDLGHPLAGNLRSGDWLVEFISTRLASQQGTVQLAGWFSSAFSSLKVLPRFLVPRYFDSVIMAASAALQQQAVSLMSPFISTGSDFVKKLAMGSVIHTSAVPSAPLPPLSPALSPPPSHPSPTLAAGLPHFSTGYMRSWGRDTFISLRGMLLVTGRFLEARDIILGYAGTLRHGLIPNLLDGGKNARFNCRDAVWWWLRAILDYIEMAEDAGQIMKDPVVRLYPGEEETVQPLEDVVSEALAVHATGLQFRERNAGVKIDEHMKDEGFNNQIGVDKETGFVFGGNISNCGTWMDKMGSSAQAGNKGDPSSPRDGSAVEIVGLSYSCLRDLARLGGEVYRHQEVAPLGTLTTWADRIKDNFDKYFWVGSKSGAEVDKKPEFTNKILIYKDTLNSGNLFTDYQLRPNYAITLAVAPDITDPHHAWAALKTMQESLLGPLGLATLDPTDWAYRGDYDNSNCSSDRTLAHGANYHQGPEWVWPVGFFLRALLKVGKLVGEPEYQSAVSVANSVLARHYSHLCSSPWLGLPELTNSKGAFCRDSNPIQAWSMATLLDTLYDMDRETA
eukprot:GFUD01013053.1.p1 GENE.GFUD01013053.1~~GFUD01013053.1.p1  ORF type:complete len:1475 (+),score=544.67 GFUD01013053.1:73-4497(+)